MTNELPVWQLILLAVVYLTDLVLIARLGRDEVRDWGNERPARPHRRWRRSQELISSPVTPDRSRSSRDSRPA